MREDDLWALEQTLREVYREKDRLLEEIYERDREIREAHQALDDALALVERLRTPMLRPDSREGWAARPSVVTWFYPFTQGRNHPGTVSRRGSNESSDSAGSGERTLTNLTLISP